MLTPRQTEIINKSIDLIATKGIQGLTIKNLSGAIGVSEPAIYRHFESKIDILLAILENFEKMTSFMNDEINGGRNTSLEKIEMMFTKIIEIFSKEPSHISVVFSEEIFKNEQVLKDRVIKIMDMKETAIAEIILEGQKQEEIRNDIDNRTLSLIVIGTLRFMVKRWDLKNQHKNLEKEGKGLIDALKLILQK